MCLKLPRGSGAFGLDGATPVGRGSCGGGAFGGVSVCDVGGAPDGILPSIVGGSVTLPGRLGRLRGSLTFLSRNLVVNESTSIVKKCGGEVSSGNLSCGSV